MNNGKNILPTGYSSRPATFEDLDGVVEVINASEKKWTGSTVFTVQDYRIDWDLPAFCLETDTRVVVDAQGEVAGVLEYWDINAPHVRYDLWGRIHPEQEGRGLGSYLLGWANERARRSMQAAPTETRLVLRSFVPSVNPEAGRLFEDHGYSMLRHALRMVINLNGDLAIPEWPDDIQVRSMQPGEEADVVRAVRDSFKDHFGFVEAPFEQDYERWMHMIRNDENFDASLWFLAVSGDEIAGISLCRSKSYDDADMGWVSTLGVRRPWRRRGLGMALLQHSFAELNRRGKLRVGLGVDAESLTGATDLYLKAGMHPDPRHQFSLYEKELRGGVDLSTRSLQE